MGEANQESSSSIRLGEEGEKKRLGKSTSCGGCCRSSGKEDQKEEKSAASVPSPTKRGSGSIAMAASA